MTIECLGATTLGDLVCQCAWLETFRPSSPLVERRADHWWGESLLVASLSQLLVGKAGKPDSRFANLLGSNQNVVDAVLLSYAQGDEPLARSPLWPNRLIDKYAANAGQMLRGQWSVPTKLAIAAANSANWLRKSTTSDPDYAVIALIAQYLIRPHRPWGAPSVPWLEVCELPSVQHLSDWFSIEDFGRHALDTARKAVADNGIHLAA